MDTAQLTVRDLLRNQRWRLWKSNVRVYLMVFSVNRKLQLLHATVTNSPVQYVACLQTPPRLDDMSD
jgi:hypothetical protein